MTAAARRRIGGSTPMSIPSYDEHAWRRQAACRLLDQDLFFPSGRAGPAASEIAERAKDVCAACPVRLACLQFALTTNQEFGVWGGYDEEERRRLRKEWRAASRR